MKEKENKYCYILKENAEGGYDKVKVEWGKLPCATCDRRYHFTCPKPDCWNKDGKYLTY